MDKLAGVSGLVVVQRKEWGEILTGFETMNKYVVLDTAGGQLYVAAEEGGSMLQATTRFSRFRPGQPKVNWKLSRSCCVQSLSFGENPL